MKLSVKLQPAAQLYPSRKVAPWKSALWRNARIYNRRRINTDSRCLVSGLMQRFPMDGAGFRIKHRHRFETSLTKAAWLIEWHLRMLWRNERVTKRRHMRRTSDAFRKTRRATFNQHIRVRGKRHCWPNRFLGRGISEKIVYTSEDLFVLQLIFDY